MSVDTTVGGAYADSFIEAIDADDFLQIIGIDETYIETWLDFEDEAKEFRLKVAAQFMGTFPLRGNLVYAYQSLCFPRSCQLDVTDIPEAVKQAQALTACLVIDKNITNIDEQAVGGDILLENALVKSVKIMGILEVGLQNTMDAATIKEQTSINKPLLYKTMKAYGAPIWMLLKPYLAQFRGGTFATRVVTATTLLDSPDYTP